ncbi:MAG TPA: ABC transporter substrate-binding protein [Aquihabitans sp.]|jgi:peptide/nickel transport system substrate-binding protein|nr:ABC transporter substrate-binding protein [Aquihabitans sp.]
MTAPRRLATVRNVAALVVALAVVGGACVLQDDDAQTVRTAGLGPRPVESGLPEDAKPVRGGQLVYGLEAETAGGFCLPESQLAASGLEIVRALYDPLAIPDAKGGYAPYLAKAIDHDESYRNWTITLRPGITFHDGSALDATVVKNNLDAYRGAYDNRSPLLFSFVFQNIAAVTVVNELSVRVTTKTPQVALPAALYGSGRVAMVAQAQLDADTDTCATEPIGTGPFQFVSWTKDVSLKVKRNPEYWQEAPDGKAYPYLDAIDFRPMPNSDARLAALQQGELNMLHTSTASDIAANLTGLRDEGAINLLVSEERTETSYMLINTKRAPLGDRAARVAIAQAIDRKKLNEIANKGFATIADGPFAPEVLGHLDDPGFPGFDLAAAKKAVAAMKEAGADTELSILTSTGPAAIRTAVVEQEMLEAAGFSVKLEVESEAGLIDRVIANDFDLATFRNQPGDDPDSNFHWWNGGGNLVNFGRFDDEVINENLVIGRTNPDRDTRRKAYETINRRFSEQVYNVYLWYAPWAVAEAANVHGILGPDLPDGGGPPPGRLVTGHALHGIWIDPD